MNARSQWVTVEQLAYIIQCHTRPWQAVDGWQVNGTYEAAEAILRHLNQEDAS